MRSNFIHKGINIDEKSVLMFRDISKAIIAILFQLHKRNSVKVKIDYEQWLAKIDSHLDKIATKNIMPNGKEWLDLGVDKMNHIFSDNYLKEVR